MPALSAPGPRRWSPVGSLPELRRDPIGTLLDARETYGDVVKFRAGIWSAYFLSHPDDVKHILLDNNQNYRKGFTFDYLKPVVGFGLLTNEGESWLRQRRLAQPAFHGQGLAELADLMAAAVGRTLGCWRERADGTPLDVAHEMSGLAMAIVSRTLFGDGSGADATPVIDAVSVAMEHVNRQITHLITIPDRFPTPRNLQFKRALDVLNTVVYSMIEQRRTAAGRACRQPENRAASAGRNEDNAGRTGSDLLSLLLEARDEETGEGMTDGQLRDEVMTIFLAGYETTANALAWSWSLLALNPEIEERLHAEVDSVLGGRTPCLADLSRLRYTRMVFDETLRLRPPVWAVCRFALAGDVASGHRIPAHASVILSPYVTHRHPAFWDDPLRFDPERFRPEPVAARPKYAYFPFGGGPRMCIGSEFAMMEGVIALATIAQEFRLRPVPGHRVELEPLITLRPRGGLPMLLERR
jgi:cytochrome P450